MDKRLTELIKALEASGYTDRYVAAHWTDDWRDKRWYGFEGTSERIFQAVIGNVYIRLIFPSAPAEPILFMRYKCVDHPGRPKTQFYREGVSKATLKSIAEIREYIPEIESLVHTEAA